MASSGEIPRIVIVGPSGSGKSATGNTLLNEDRFQSVRSLSATNQRVQSAQGKHMCNYYVIDTPPLPASPTEKTKVEDEMKKCMQLAKEDGGRGLDAIVLTLNGTVFSKESEQAIESLPHFFGDSFAKHLIVVYTRADQAGESFLAKLEDQQRPNCLRKLHKACNYRVLSFNNKEQDGNKKNLQVFDLMQMVNKMKAANAPLCYEMNQNDKQMFKSPAQPEEGDTEEKCDRTIAFATDDQYSGEIEGMAAAREMDSSRGLYVAIIGPAGSGKSALGNTVLGRKAFESKRSLTSTTKHTDCRQSEQGRNISVIDTPPLPDTRNEMSYKELAAELTTSMTNAAKGINGLDAIVLTLNANDRFTQETVNGIEFVKNLYGEKFLNFLIIVFTREDLFDSEDISLEDSLFSDETPDYLRNLFSSCKKRVLTINNRAGSKENQSKVKKLLSMIDGMTNDTKLQVQEINKHQDALDKYKKACIEMEKKANKIDNRASGSKCSLS